VLIPDAL